MESERDGLDKEVEILKLQTTQQVSLQRKDHSSLIFSPTKKLNKIGKNDNMKKRENLPRKCFSPHANKIMYDSYILYWK